MHTIELADKPAMLGRYEILCKIASGGMGTVFLARLASLGGFQRLVALKRLHPHLAEEREFVDMFVDEARLAARIHHPNVVPILDISEDAGSYFVVMDYVEGETVGGLLVAAHEQNQQLPLPIIHRIVLDALAGLHAAHELTDDAGRCLDLVHRDVSPYNILVGVDGMTRLTDFGVARAVQRSSKTKAGEIKGNVPFMSPEQAAGRPLDRRSDLFSMASVLWETYTCRRLFGEDGPLETMKRILDDEIRPPSSLRRDLPPSLDEVCMRALERDPRARYPTAAHWAEALEKAARVAGLLAEHRDVSACVRALVGPSIERRRATHRNAMEDYDRARSAIQRTRRAGAASVGGAPTERTSSSQYRVESAGPTLRDPDDAASTVPNRSEAAASTVRDESTPTVPFDEMGAQLPITKPAPVVISATLQAFERPAPAPTPLSHQPTRISGAPPPPALTPNPAPAPAQAPAVAATPPPAQAPPVAATPPPAMASAPTLPPALAETFPTRSSRMPLFIALATFLAAVGALLIVAALRWREKAPSHSRAATSTQTTASPPPTTAQPVPIEPVSVAASGAPAATAMTSGSVVPVPTTRSSSGAPHRPTTGARDAGSRGGREKEFGKGPW